LGKLDYTNSYTTTFDKFIQKVKVCDSYNVIIHIVYRKTPLFQSYNLISEGQHLPDLFTIHITTKTALNCSSVLGIIHSLFKPVPDQFIDQIAIEEHPLIKHLKTKVTIND